MPYIPYGPVCESETQILLAGGIDLIDAGDLDAGKGDLSEIERMLKALIKLLKNKPLNP